MTAAETRAYGWIGVAARPATYAVLFVATLALAANVTNPFAMDFVSYWAAGVLTLDGNPAASYDYALHRAVELQVVPLQGGMPFPYAPPYLLLVAPFALLPYSMAVIVWVLITLAGYLYSVRRLAPQGGWVAMSFPPVLTNAVMGQNAFLTCGLMAGGMSLLTCRPFVAGLVLGGLILKPQLGMVLPFVLIAGREWRAFWGAAVSSSGLLALGAAVFGFGAYQAWLAQAPLYTQIVTDGLVGWHKTASVYAALRLAGADGATATAVHMIVAILAISAASLVWYRSRDIGARAGSLAAATALASPYLYGNDTLILVLAFLWLASKPGQRVALALIWLLSLAGFLQNWWGEVFTLNLIPLVSIALLTMVCRQALREASDVPPRGATPLIGAA